MSSLSLFYLIVGIIYGAGFNFLVLNDDGRKPSGIGEWIALLIFTLFAMAAWPFCLVMDIILTIQDKINK